MSIARLVAAVLCFVSAPLLIAQSTTAANTGDLIHKIESCLPPAVVVKGEPPSCTPLLTRMQQLHIQGVSIAVVHHGVIEWARGYGIATPDNKPVTPETIFQAGSISKPVASMGALRLVQEGKLSLDADVNTKLTSWKVPASDAAPGAVVTLRELMTHTAGMTVHGFPGYAAGDPVPTLVQVLNGEKPANTAAIKSEQPPMKEWKYSGGGYTIMQQALIDVTHEPFPKLLHDSVLAPIGMKHSTYEQPLPEALRTNAATPYRGDGKPVEGGAHTYPEMAAAGLWTTPTDLAIYAIEVERSLLGKANHVLSADMTRQMLTPGMGHWGLGLEIGGSDADPYFSHGGANEGFRNNFAAYEKNGEGVFVMTSGDNGGQIADEVMHSVANEYQWPDFKPTVRTAIHVDPKVLASYEGTYELLKGFDLVVTLEDGQLMTQATGQGKVPIFAETETKFFPTVIPAEIEFVKDDQGKVTSLVLHQGGHDMKAPKK